VNLTGVFPHLHLNSSYSAALEGIVHCFLQNSKEGKSDFDWHNTGYISSAVDLYFLPRGAAPTRCTAVTSMFDRIAARSRRR